MSTRRTQHGFTLVEISVVMVIIALIVGGILVARELIRQAEVRSVTADTQKIQSAIYAFQKKYDYWPGDFPRAQTYWGTHSEGCPVSTIINPTPQSTTCNGDGNGKLNPPAGGHVCTTSITGSSYEQEPYRLWQHLSNAEMYPGLYTGVHGPGGILHGVPGTNIPLSTKIAGVGFQLMNFGEVPSTDIGWLADVPFGNVLFIGMEDETGDGVINPCYEPNYPFLSAQETYDLDIKIDDGRPGSGNLRTFWPNDTRKCADSNTVATASYADGTNPNGCSLVMLLNW